MANNTASTNIAFVDFVTPVPAAWLNNLNAIGNDIWDAKSFGATGLGAANDTIAIQGMLNLLSAAGGGIAFFGPGKYLVNQITMYPNIQIMGVGPATQFIPASNNQTIFQMTAGAITAANSSFKNFQINAGSFTGITGISSIYYGNITYENLTFTSCQYSIVADRGRIFFANNILVQGSIAQGQSGGIMHIYSSTDTEYIADFKCARFYVLNIGNGTSSTGIYCRRATGACFTQCGNNDMNTGNTTPGTFIIFENDCQGCKISDSLMVACQEMVLFQTGTGVNVPPSFCTVDNCDFDQNYTTGVLIHTGNYITITGGNMTTSGVNAGGSGIIIQGTSHILIDGVRFNGWNVAPNGAAILLGTIDQLSILNCYFENCYQGVGVPAATVTNTLIQNNAFDASVTNSIGGVWSGTGATNKASNNRGWAPQGLLALPTFPATGVTITNTNAVNAMVYVTGGTISSTVLNGQTIAGIPSGIFLEPGDTIGFNYTGSPTWTWIAEK